MLSPESIQKNQERWWSYDTPYDIINRRELVRNKEKQKVQDIDAYITYVNEEMADSYLVATRFDERSKKTLKQHKSKGTRVYKVNRQGYYVPHGHVSMAATFYGDKITLDGHDPVVINSELGLGITPSEYVKFSSRQTSDLQYGVEYRYREKAFAEVVSRLMALDKGDSMYIREWDSPWG